MRFLGDMHKHGMCTSIVNPTGNWHSSYLIWNSCACFAWNAAIPIKRISMRWHNGRTCESESKWIKSIDSMCRLEVECQFSHWHTSTSIAFAILWEFFWMYQYVESATKKHKCSTTIKTTTHDRFTPFSLSVCAYDFHVYCYLLFSLLEIIFNSKKNATFFPSQFEIVNFCTFFLVCVCSAIGIQVHLECAYTKIVWKYVTLILCFLSQLLLFSFKLKTIFQLPLMLPPKRGSFIYCYYSFGRLPQACSSISGAKKRENSNKCKRLDTGHWCLLLSNVSKEFSSSCAICRAANDNTIKYTVSVGYFAVRVHIHLNMNWTFFQWNLKCD